MNGDGCAAALIAAALLVVVFVALVGVVLWIL